MPDRYRRSWVSLLEPVRDDYPPLTRREGQAAALFLLLPLQVLWFATLWVEGGSPLGLDEALAAALVPTGALFAVLAIAWVVPPTRWLRSVGLEPYLVAARRRGLLDGWDRVLLGVSVLALIGVFFRDETPYRVAAGIIVAQGMLVLWLLAGQPDPEREEGSWDFTLPDWLRGRADESEEGAAEGKRAEEADLVPPDDDAQPVYLFDTRDGDRHPVGVRIPSEVLERLRELNAKSQGSLYQAHPEAVVLASGPPVGKIGTDELTRLARQIASIARQHGWTRFTTVNRILEFVQEAITYRYDEDSTTDFEGGPYEEYGRFALETIWDGVGDCECTSILCGALLAYLGLPSCLIFVTIPGSGGHVAVGVRRDAVLGASNPLAAGLHVVTGDDGEEYLYGETAVDGALFGFGVVPEDWGDRLEVEWVCAVCAVEAPGA